MLIPLLIIHDPNANGWRNENILNETRPLLTGGRGQIEGVHDEVLGLAVVQALAEGGVVDHRGGNPSAVEGERGTGLQRGN